MPSRAWEDPCGGRRPPPPRLFPITAPSPAPRRSSTMFKKLSEPNLLRAASVLRRVDLKKGDLMLVQDEPTQEMYVITRGSVVRIREEEREHEFETLGAKGSSATVGALHLLNKERYYATVRRRPPPRPRARRPAARRRAAPLPQVRCTSDVTAFALTSEQLHELLDNSAFAREVIFALTKEPEVVVVSRLGVQSNNL